MNLLLLSELARIEDIRYRLTREQYGHITSVLKLEVGDTVKVGIPDGPLGIGRIVELDETGGIVEVESLNAPPPPKKEIDLICAMPRPPIARRVLFAAGMLHVRSVAFIRSNRVEKSYFDSPLWQNESYRQHLYDGLAQGEHTRVPSVEIHTRFRPFVEDILPEKLQALPDTSIRIVPHNDERRVSVKKIVDSGRQVIIAAIGPEGGWVPYEIEKFSELGFIPATLGDSNLRVDFAVTALLAQIELMSLSG